MFFFFKQKTAYEMRISDWSSDVCSSDLQVDPMNPWTHFREATWEEALEKAAGGLKKVYEENGPKGLAGFGSAKGSNEEAYLFQKLIRTAFHTNNVDHCTRLCPASSVAALMEGIGSGSSEGPRVGKEGVRPCRTRGSPFTKK